MRHILIGVCISALALMVGACGTEGVPGGDGGSGGLSPGGAGGGGSGGSGGGAECATHVECPDERPECAEGRCQACTEDASCEGRGFCETETGLCVECLRDEHCEGDGAECVDNVCIECRANEDCPSGLCSQGKCQPPLPCSNGECPEGFACQRTTNQCWPTCDVLAEEPSCVGENVCAVMGARFGGEVVGACVPDTGSAQAGESCGEGDEDECSLRLFCSQEPAGRICRQFCDPEEEGCPEGMECAPLEVVDPNGATADIGFCRPPVRTCERRADCEEDEVCRFEICIPAQGSGGKGSGESCTEGDECATGVCYDLGVCSGTCATGDDCAPGTECVAVTVNVGEVTVEERTCLPGCDSDAECPSNRFCNWLLDATGEKLISTCLGQAVGSKGPGEECTAALHCRSGLCEMGSSGGGYCFGRCLFDEDCAGDLVCRDMAFFSSGEPVGSLGMCGGKDCARESDCGSWSCRPAGEGSPPVLVFRCEPPLGTGNGGDPCFFNDDCKSGLCFPGLGCGELCVEGIDCESGICVGSSLQYQDEFYDVATCL